MSEPTKVKESCSQCGLPFQFQHDELAKLVKALEWTLPRVDTTHLSGSALIAYQDARALLISVEENGYVCGVKLAKERP